MKGCEIAGDQEGGRIWQESTKASPPQIESWEWVDLEDFCSLLSVILPSGSFERLEIIQILIEVGSVIDVRDVARAHVLALKAAPLKDGRNKRRVICPLGNILGRKPLILFEGPDQI